MKGMCPARPHVIHRECSATLCDSGARCVAFLPRRAGMDSLVRRVAYGASKGGRAMGLFSEIFSWWGGNTWSNRLYTAVRGRLVGSDAAGNRYYVQNKGIGPLGVPRRWVIYKNLAEASQV